MAKRKMVAPIIITIIVCLWAMGQAAGVIFFASELSLWIVITAIVIPLVFVGLMIYVLVERIRDIESGEEDDLDNY